MKKCRILMITLILLTLSGCKSIDSFTNNLIEEKSQIKEDEDYLRYENWKQNNQIDDNGEFQEQSDNDSSKSGKIHITFGTNSDLTIKYYYDENLDVPIDIENCYMNPGETIYCSEPVIINANSNTYVMNNFKIVEFDDEKNIINKYENNNLEKIEINENCNGSSISILPVGEYKDRKLSLNDYYVKSNRRQELSGKWTVNDIETYEESVTISGTSKYDVIYEYDPDVYYVVKSSPSVQKEEKGKIIFESINPNSDNSNFSVELRQHDDKGVTVYLDTTDEYGICKYTVDGEEASGKVVLQLNQKLKLEYSITSSNYEIDYGSGFFNVFKNKEKQKISIDITDDLNGKTITRSDYINVKRKG